MSPLLRRAALLGSVVAWLCCGEALAGGGGVPEAVRDKRCDDLDTESLVRAIETELPQLLSSSAEPLRFGRVRISRADYAKSTLMPLLQLARRGARALCGALPTQFQFVPLAVGNRAHVTAYYHPVLRGSRTRHGTYQHPLYLRPAGDHSQLTTAQILDGGLTGQGLEVVYLESLSAALNVHIEGSATVQLNEGGEVNLTTDGHNGHPYTNPFKLARKDKAIPADQPTPPGVSKANAFFSAHPEVLRIYWSRDPHFVFFKETPLRGTGKFGELVTGRSIAIDRDHVPMGAAVWLRTEVATAAPEDGPVQHTPIARLALAQDTGAAIRGIGRVDLFVGSGEAAALAAARTSRPGDLYLLLRKSARGRRQK